MHLRRFPRSKRLFAFVMLVGFTLSMWFHGPQVYAQVPYQAKPHQLWLSSASPQSSQELAVSAPELGLEQPWMSQAQKLMGLALSHQQAGKWRLAQAAVSDSIALLQQNLAADKASTGQWKFLGQALNIQGSLQFHQGQHRQALESWEAATEAYGTAGYDKGQLLSQINQAQALRELGFHRRALDLIETVVAQLGHNPEADASLQAIALQRQGDLLRLMGSTNQSKQVLEASLAIAQTAPNAEQSPYTTGQTLLSLANTARAQGNDQEAIALYQQAAAQPLPPQSQVQLQLSQLQLLLRQEQWADATKLSSKIQPLVTQLPASHSNAYSQINLAESLLSLQQHSQTHRSREQDIIQLLSTAAGQSQQLGDAKAQSYALGVLGQLHEQNQQWKQAHEVTQQAIDLAEKAQAVEILYQWYWQQGRIFKAQGQWESAIAQTQQSVQLLKSLRKDLIVATSDNQFSFQDNIEPVYRDLAELLLQQDSKGEVEQTRLSEALEVIDGLQVAELENFLKKACGRAEQIDQIDDQAAVIYPIILNDHLDIIVHLPNQPLKHYSSSVTKAEFEATLRAYRQTLVIRSRRSFYKPSQQLYEWLIQPMAQDLQQSRVSTLVFVPDSALNNVPMAALHDGQQFLLESYNIAITPSLKLLGPAPLSTNGLSSLAAGISQANGGFQPLQYVRNELASIKEILPHSTTILDEAFTIENFQAQVANLSAPILHLASHGMFSSSPDETFILAWDQVMSLETFDQILRQAPDGIDLLILSACETAQGDRRASLGLTGVAVEAGAKSTVATLWSIDDFASAEFMKRFYKQLNQPGMTRAEALRNAQLEILKEPYYGHPLYWAPYVMVGNWL